ncbi:DTW domain-containing protein YfiP [Ferrimonas sediminum]|uniref:tRNA-uridine aminocarboxypropyltransferase n=1 Tax=Ferrimonas sediminum TaxID=718193 RepID=A0A1G8K3X0_9GAMM|nr:tRNA-uridine aminocarboxypropyltransferase [Ferrimonas sediminum]SDI38142.1 DTW domain-containing protein YfiP [Ferrimonas sediminum]
MSKRPTCPHCQRPQKVCLCAAIAPVHNRHPIHILQHPSEANAAKGTAALSLLCLDKGQLWPGEHPEDFASLRQRLADSDHPSYLLYPGEDATAMETLGQDSAPLNLLVLDGTWKKVYRLLQLNPWLQALPKLSFAEVPKGDYQIRKAHRADSLSTLEAIAHGLNTIDRCDTGPLFAAFDALKASQLAHMPADVKHRYQTKS